MRQTILRLQRIQANFTDFHIKATVYNIQPFFKLFQLIGYNYKWIPFNEMIPSGRLEILLKDET